MLLLVEKPKTAVVLGQEPVAAKPVPQPVMYLGAVGAVKAIIFKVKAWDPNKHPRGYKGMFSETPDHLKMTATEAGVGDVIVSKAGKAFQVEKQTDKGVKVKPINLDTGEVKSGYTVLGNDVKIAVFDKGKPVGSIHPISELEPGTYIQHPNSGKRWVIKKHGKWTTVLPVDDQGNVKGKHTVLPPQTQVLVSVKAVHEATASDAKKVAGMPGSKPNPMTPTEITNAYKQAIQNWFKPDPQVPWETPMDESMYKAIASQFDEDKPQTRKEAQQAVENWSLAWNNELPAAMYSMGEINTALDGAQYEIDQRAGLSPAPVKAPYPPKPGDAGEKAFDELLPLIEHQLDLMAAKDPDTKTKIDDWKFGLEAMNGDWKDGLRYVKFTPVNIEGKPMDTSESVDALKEAWKPRTLVEALRHDALAEGSVHSTITEDYLRGLFFKAQIENHKLPNSVAASFLPKVRKGPLATAYAQGAALKKWEEDVKKIDLDYGKAYVKWNAAQAFKGGPIKPPYPPEPPTSEQAAQDAFVTAVGEQLDKWASIDHAWAGKIGHAKLFWKSIATDEPPTWQSGLLNEDIKTGMAFGGTQKLGDFIAQEGVGQTDITHATRQILTRIHGKPVDESGSPTDHPLDGLLPGSNKATSAIAIKTHEARLQAKPLHSAWATKVDKIDQQYKKDMVAFNEAGGNVQEILPTKLPVVPKPYPPGVGKDTKITITIADVRKTTPFKDYDGHSGSYVIRRVGPGGKGQVLGIEQSMTAALRIARRQSAAHEAIESHRVTFKPRFGNTQQEADAAKPGFYVNTATGALVEIKNVEALAKIDPTSAYESARWIIDETRYNFPADGTGIFPRETTGKNIATGYWASFEPVDPNDPIIKATLESAKKENWLGLTKGTNQYSPENTKIKQEASKKIKELKTAEQPVNGEVPSTYVIDLLKSRRQITEEEVKRKPRPERFIPQLQFDWSFDQLQGATTNEALKTLGKVGYREIRPRQNGSPKVVNRNGQRLRIEVKNGKVENIDRIKIQFEAVSPQAAEYKQQLDAAIETVADLSALDPHNEPFVEAQQSHVRSLLWQMAVGKQHGVAEKLGKTVAGAKVKTDEQYTKEIEAEAFFGDAEFKAKIPKEPLKIRARGTVISMFGMQDDPNWDYSLKELKPPDDFTKEELVALSALANRRGVAEQALGEHTVVDAAYDTGTPVFDPNLKIAEGENIFDAARKLAAEHGAGYPGLPQPEGYDPLQEMDPKNVTPPEVASKLYLKSAYDTSMEKVDLQINAHDKTYDDKWHNLKFQAIKAEIAKRRKAEGTLESAADKPDPVQFDIPTWDEVDMQPQKIEEVSQLVHGLDGRAQDVPVFVTGGLLKDGVMQIGENTAYGEVPVELDEVAKVRLMQEGATMTDNSQNLEKILGGYHGSGKMYQGNMLLLEEGIQQMTDEDKKRELLSRVREQIHLQFGDPEKDASDMNDADIEMVNAVEGVLQKFDPAKQNAVLNTQDDFKSWSIALRAHLASETYGEDPIVVSWFGSTGTVNGADPLNITFDQWRKQLEDTGQNITRRIEYVPHDQEGDLKPDSQGLTTGAPTSQRGQLRMTGYTPEQAVTRLKDLGIIHGLEEEVPFSSVLRSHRRYGRVLPLHPDYVTGQADPPTIKHHITHGITGGVTDLKSILRTGAILPISERVRLGLVKHEKTATSKKGDARSGIDQGVFSTVGKSSWGSIVAVYKDGVFLRRGILVAPNDFGGSATRYSAYASHHNQDRAAVGDPKANLYDPLSPAARQYHISHHTSGSGNEWNPIGGVPMEDIKYLVVTSLDQKVEAEEILNSMLLEGTISEAPIVLTNTEADPKVWKP